MLEQLRQICGAANVLTHDDPATDLSPWEQDWRKRVRGRALAVVRPGDTAQVAAVVKACAAAGTPIVPQGGNTGLVVGSVPDASGTQVVLSLTRMNAVRAIDKDNLTITVSVGESLFDERFGLAHAKPKRLSRMVGFPNDALEADCCHGDLSLQFCSNTKPIDKSQHFASIHSITNINAIAGANLHVIH